MIDLRRLYVGLTRAIRNDAPDAALLASALDLDLSRARIVMTKSVMAIHDARFNSADLEIDAAWGFAPHREIWLLIARSSLPYRDIKDEIFGVDQRTQPSRLSAGFAVLFEIDGWTCGYTADSPDANVSAVFCESRGRWQGQPEERRRFGRDRSVR
jgi:hypothetical protein